MSFLKRQKKKQIINKKIGVRFIPLIVLAGIRGKLTRGRFPFPTLHQQRYA
jgi:hypothetical protein